MNYYLNDYGQPPLQSRVKGNASLLNPLYQAWGDAGIDGSYQRIIEEYLQYLQYPNLEEEIEREIGLTASQRSFYYSLRQLESRRINILEQLRVLLLQLERLQYKTQKHFEQVCVSIDQLRAINLAYAQQLMNIHNYFIAKIKEPALFTAMNSLFLSLHEDNQPLRTSLMRKFIVFSQSYDPFLLKHYQLLKSTNNPRLKEIQCIEELFDVPINIVYRMTKTQQQIKQYLRNGAESRPGSTRTKKIESYANSPTLRRKGISQREEQPINDFKLLNDVYLNKRQERLTPDKIYSSNDRSNQRKESGDSQGYLTQGRQSVYRTYRLRQEPVNLPRISTLSLNSQKEPNFRIRSTKTQKNRESDTSGNKNSSSLTKRKYNLDRSIAIVQQRERDFKNYIKPKRFFSKDQKSEGTNRYSQIRRTQHVKERNIFEDRNSDEIEKKEISVQCEQITLNPNPIKETIPKTSKKPAEREIAVQANEQIYEEPQKPTEKVRTKNTNDTATIQSKKSKKDKPKTTFRNYKLKAPTTSTPEIFTILKTLTISPSYRKIFEVNNWEQAITVRQFYYHTLHIDDEIAAVVLCCALPNGDILIKYWGPLAHCDQEMSNFLFGKFVQHLEKHTNAGRIVFNAVVPINELSNHNFVKTQQRVYERNRIQATQRQQDDYSPFLSINFTNIAINKATPNQEKLLPDGQIKKFEVHRLVCFNYLLIINKLMGAGSFASIAKYFPSLKTIQNANLKIIEQQITDIPYNADFKCSYCHLLTLSMKMVVFSAHFLADKQYIQSTGDVILDDDESFIICLPMLLYNVKMYFAKGFKNTIEVAEKVKRAGKSNKKMEFKTRMFRKLLRGRLLNINLKEENCYANLEIAFVWRDDLQGRILHKSGQCEVFDNNFHCLVEMERQTLFAFQIQPSDCL